MSQFNPESSYVRTYLDWLTELPWSVSSSQAVDVKQAEKILNEDHFGLKIKERILEYLAVIELKNYTRRKDQRKKTNPPFCVLLVPLV